MFGQVLADLIITNDTRIARQAQFGSSGRRVTISAQLGISYLDKVQSALESNCIKNICGIFGEMIDAIFGILGIFLHNFTHPSLHFKLL